jgi:hypothetical protein
VLPAAAAEPGGHPMGGEGRGGVGVEEEPHVTSGTCAPTKSNGLETRVALCK